MADIEDVLDRLGYCKIIHEAPHHYRDVEEEMFFPEIGKSKGWPEKPVLQRPMWGSTKISWLALPSSEHNSSRQASEG
jgi:hypothetical protein